MYTDDELRTAVANSNCYSRVLIELNRSPTSIPALYFLTKRISELEIDISHFGSIKLSPTKSHPGKRNFLVTDESLVYRITGARLRRALIEYGAEYKCNVCNTSDWQDKNLILHVDHIDGNWRNNTPENLRFLCPNCHSQVPIKRTLKPKNRCTQCDVEIGRGAKCCKPCDKLLRQKEPEVKPVKVMKQKVTRPKKAPVVCSCGERRHPAATQCWSCYQKTVVRKSSKPDIETLRQLISEKPITHISREYGVCDSAVIKWCKSYGLQRPGRGYWRKVQCGKI